MTANLTLILYKKNCDKSFKKKLKIQLINHVIKTQYTIKKYWKDPRMVKIDVIIYVDSKLTETEWKNLFQKFGNCDLIAKDNNFMEIACYSNLIEPKDIFATLYIPNSMIETA